MHRRRHARIIAAPPIVAAFAAMEIDWTGVRTMLDWVADRRPACLPEEWIAARQGPTANDDLGLGALLFPHNLHDDRGRLLTGNELLVELCGRKCYDSFGAKAGKKSNRLYIEHTQGGDVPHRSILYHAKMTFFLAGVSRRVSHEFIRNYVGSDREEEGSPSQESTRYVEHAGTYIVHPRDLASAGELSQFVVDMDDNYGSYLDYIDRQTVAFRQAHDGVAPKGMDHKRILEAASARLSHSCETSWIWTTNPIALAKLVQERAGEAADLEFQRLARAIAAVAVGAWPNLFPQPWMAAAAAQGAA